MTDNDRKWYTVQTYSGYENKVKANLDQRIASMGMENKIFRVLVPTEERIIVKDGKTRKVSHKLFPSYVLVEMIMDDQSWYVVRHTPGVSNFVGVGNRPLPVSPEEIDEILIKIGEKEAPAAPRVEITCDIGDRVRVLSGAFAGAEGPVTEIIPARGKVKFAATVFGHETEIEVDFAELEKL